MTGTTLVGDLLSTVQTDVLANVGAALPIAGAVFAALAGITVGVKIFKKLTGARA